MRITLVFRTTRCRPSYLPQGATRAQGDDPAATADMFNINYFNWRRDRVSTGLANLFLSIFAPSKHFSLLSSHQSMMKSTGNRSNILNGSDLNHVEICGLTFTHSIVLFASPGQNRSSNIF